MFFQPVSVFPVWEKYQPLRNAAILALLLFILSKKERNASFVSNKINVFFILFMAMQVISSSQIWLRESLETFNFWLKIGIVYFLIINSVTDERKVKWILVSIIAAISYLGYYSIEKFIVSYAPGVRASGFGWYENPNDLAIILVSVIPFVMLMFNLSDSGFIRLLFLLTAGIFSFIILFTGSRNGLLGLAIVGILSIKTSDKIKGVLKPLFTIILIFFMASIGIKGVLSRQDAVSGLRGDDSAESRIIQWKAGWRMLLSNPLFGVAPGQFRENAADYGGIRGLDPHNTFVQVYSETGVLGGLFFTFFSFFSFWGAVKIIKQSREKSKDHRMIILRFLCISLIGFWVCAFFSNRYQFYILYVIVALLVAVQNQPTQKGLKAK